MRKKHKTYLIQASLFLLTLLTTTLAGAEWSYGRFFFVNEDGLGWNQWIGWKEFKTGLVFSLSFIGILTIHEFGHYITARLYKVKVTLPYYLPFFIGIVNTIGTFGAFIKIKSYLKSTKEIFDIGIAGPLAGFFAALILLWFGFTNLPPRDHIFEIHPEYAQYGDDYEDHVYSKDFFVQQRKSMGDDTESPDMLMSLGSNLVFKFFENFVAEDPSLVPNKYEMMHYPILFAGYLALLFTALNLLPVGQLDGGHILYGLIGGRRHNLVSPAIFVVFVTFAGIGIFKENPLGNAFSSIEDFAWFSFIYLFFLYFIFSRIEAQPVTKALIAVSVFSFQFFIEFLFPDFSISNGWLFFAFVVGRFLGIYHPPAMLEEPLDKRRQVLGWFALIVFILCFTPQIFSIEVLE